MLYGLLMTLLQPFLLIKLLWRSRCEPGYRHAMAARLGWYGSACPSQPGWIWLHAVSLGETRAAVALVAALRESFPTMRLLVTHSTATGWEAGKALMRCGDLQVWAPWDSPGAVRRFLTRFEPVVGLVMETEVWPGWMSQSHRLGVPMVLVNARLSSRSARKALAWGRLMRPAYEKFSLVLAQSSPDAQRLQSLGAGPVHVVGNLKYDMRPDQALLNQAADWRRRLKRPIILLASSRDGEESMWAQAVQEMGVTPEVQWLIVPRHPQRVQPVESMLRARGWAVSRRSAWLPCGPEVRLHEPSTIWLGDSLGEMALFYGLADVALLGGSFAPLGGQNLMEALACGCPVISGPHMDNFRQAQADLAGDALSCAGNMREALDLALSWVADGRARATKGEIGRAQVAAHRGAVERSMMHLRAPLGG